MSSNLFIAVVRLFAVYLFVSAGVHFPWNSFVTLFNLELFTVLGMSAWFFLVCLVVPTIL